MTNSEKKEEFFSSRWGLILSMIGVAVGAGNIWRFSRIVAQNGGGSFMIPWTVFLFIWSIPLVITEIAMGKLTRKAPIGALALTGGKSIGWMGAFIATVTTGILFYYSIVIGWGFVYFLYSITGVLTRNPDHYAVWQSFIHSYQPLYAHVLAVGTACWIIYKGIVKGIEKTNKILIPSLLVMIFIICIRAVTLPGAWEGIKYLFTPHMEDLLNYRVWIEALIQNAWDTGAGWGLLLIYAGYIQKKESVTVNGCITAVSNNAISLIMGITIFSAVFSLEHLWGIEELKHGVASTNTGLTFIYIPKIFEQLPGGPIIHLGFSAIFFLAFSFAALSSVMSMYQLTAQVFNELGIPRNTAIWITGILAILLGAPSALSMAFFDNQDWVWSSGLIVNGLFIAIGVIRYGVNRYRLVAVNSSKSDFKIGRIYNFMIAFLVPTQAVILLIWTFYRSVSESGIKDFWNPFRLYSIGSLIFQWGISMILFLILNRWLVNRTLKNK
ncbi:MAG: sodium-dependent transporter [Chlamydiia bacterium]|nr:sodium-dependent transporter [Chlamydiia bacterium]